MESTIKASVTGVCEGYFGKQHPRVWEYWVFVKLYKTSQRESAKTYQELVSILKDKYNLRLPDNQRDLHWYNYGQSYNYASLN